MKNISPIIYCITKKISSNNKWRKSFLFLFISLAVSQGCKDENELGRNILPPGDQIGTVFCDTTAVVTYTALDDSVRTDELSVQLLGSDKDPVFGLSVASVFSQVYLAGTPAFGTSPIADSLVLSLAYFNYYGDTTAMQTVRVYRLSESMNTDSTYYSSKYFLNDSTNELGALTFSPKPNTKITVGTDTAAIPQIRIALGQHLADSILSLGGTTTLSANSEWLNYFKGIYLKADPVTGPAAISYLNFFNSKLTLYFHNTTDTTAYNFSLTGSRLNHFHHDFSGSTVGSQIGNTSDSINYLQSMAGVKTKISFPNLKHFLDSGSILINRAELTITAGTGGTYTPLPTKLILVTRNSGGEIIFPVDYFETSGYYGGDLNSNTNVYTFNIARQLQRYLDDVVTNSDFELIVAGNGVIADRAAIKSGSNSSNRMKLSIYYTKLN